MNTRRIIQLVALLMIGDGVLGSLKPRWHSLLWDIGPKPFRDLIENLAAHPANTRLLYALEVGVGVWLAAQQTPEKPPLL